MSSHPGSHLSTGIASAECRTEIEFGRLSGRALANSGFPATGNGPLNNKPREVSVGPPEPAFLLLDSSLSPIYCNAEAVKILAYPDFPKNGTSLERLLKSKIQSGLTDIRLGHAGEFASGRRRYLCRVFPVVPAASPSRQTPAIAILLERRWSWSFDASRIASKFRLSQRERQTMELLFQGLSGKEIASRLKVSPNTVKVFLRMIMVKTGVTSRSGLMGRVFGSTPSI
jgi:DNA-binding CsgD family transcriptional regulator